MVRYVDNGDCGGMRMREGDMRSCMWEGGDEGKDHAEKEAKIREEGEQRRRNGRAKQR